MKKFFSLVLALTAAMAMNATDYYFAGAANGWSNNSESYKFTDVNGTLTLQVPDLYGEFKICENGAWHPQHGGAAEGEGVAMGGSYTLVKCDDSQGEADAPANATILGLEGDFRYKNATLTLNASNPNALVISLVSGEKYDHSLVEPVYYIVGAFQGWSLETAVPFEKDPQGVLTANIADFSGTFKIIQDKAWDPQWGSNGAGLVMNTPYALTAKGDGPDPANIAFANPFAGYTNAVLTLAVGADGALTLTMTAGTFYAVQNDWYMPCTKLGWNINDDTKFTKVANKENTYELLMAEFSGDLKVVYGEWAVEFGANQVGDTWAINTPYTMTYPCAGNLNPTGDDTFTDVTATIVVDYEACTVQLTLSTEGTALHNIKAAYKTLKTIENGRVIIYRGEKRFNILGTQE